MGFLSSITIERLVNAHSDSVAWKFNWSSQNVYAGILVWYKCIHTKVSVKNEGCSPLNIPVMSLRPLRTKKRFFPIRSLPWNPIPSPPFPCSKGMPLIHASTAATPCTPASTPWDPKITYTENHLRPMNLSISIMGSGRSRGLKWSLVIWAPLVSRRLKHWNFSACPWLNF